MDDFTFKTVNERPIAFDRVGVPWLVRRRYDVSYNGKELVVLQGLPKSHRLQPEHFSKHFALTSAHPAYVVSKKGQSFFLAWQANSLEGNKALACAWVAWQMGWHFDILEDDAGETIGRYSAEEGLNISKATDLGLDRIDAVIVRL